MFVASFEISAMVEAVAPFEVAEAPFEVAQLQSMRNFESQLKNVQKVLVVVARIVVEASFETMLEMIDL